MSKLLSVLMLMLIIPIGAAMFTGCRDCPVDVDPCNNHAVLIGGVDDNFSQNNVEEAEPSHELLAYMTANYYNPFLLHHFDQNHIDRPVGHTFRIPGLSAANPGKVTKAIVTMRVRAEQSNATDNDWLHLFVNDGHGGVQGIYNASLRELNGGAWNSNDTKLVTLDLANLSGEAETDVRQKLNDGVLHVYLQDDTEVDFYKLEVEYCLGSQDEPLH